MEREKLKSLLLEIGLSGGKRGELKDSGDNVQFCCPFHGETRPSAGIHVYDEIGRCFACGEHFNLTKLVAHCMDWTFTLKDKDGKKYDSYDYRKADEWLEEKYNVEKKTIDKKSIGIQKIEDDELDEEEELQAPERHEISKLKLAVFKSGKAVHEYFFERGFTKETAKKFLIGWDAKRMRITIPVLWEDGVPCGVIGRAVLEMKIDGKRNPEFYKVYKQSEFNDFKYHIYDNFPVGDVIFPLPYFKPVDDMAVLVEGQFDAMWCHENGFTQVVSTLGSKIAFNRRLSQSKQIQLLHKFGVRKVLLMRDTDIAGQKGEEHDYKLLKSEGFIVYKADYPEGKTDPQQLTKQEIQNMIDNKYLYQVSKVGKTLRRIDD